MTVLDLPSCGVSVADAATVADAMLTRPTLHAPSATVGELRRFFRDEHVHLALLADRGRLVAAVERHDLAGAPDAEPARRYGRLAGRVTAPGEPLDEARAAMRRRGGRRLAVVDAEGALVGLLCLKASGRGFCSDAGVDRRRAA